MRTLSTDPNFKTQDERIFEDYMSDPKLKPNDLAVTYGVSLPFLDNSLRRSIAVAGSTLTPARYRNWFGDIRVTLVANVSH